MQTLAQQGAQSSTLFAKVEVGGGGRFCPVKCEIGLAPTYHTNVQGQKGQERVGKRGGE